MTTIHESNSGLLRSGLIMNALFSSVCAVILLMFSEPLAKTLFASQTIWFGRPAAGVLTNVGIGLCAFVLLVFFRALQKRLSQSGARDIIIGDFIWVGVSAVMLTTGAGYLSNTGFSTILFVAIAVMIFAIIQSLGLKILYQGRSKISVENQDGTIVLNASREVETTQETAWRVISDHEGYADVADNLSKVSVISGDSVGMTRECFSVNGDSWSERAHIWEEGHRYGFQVDTQRADYPYPLESMAGIWSVDEFGKGKCCVSMNFKIQPLNSLKGRLFGKVMVLLFSTGCDRLLGKWEEMMSTKHK